MKRTAGLLVAFCCFLSSLAVAAPAFERVLPADTLVWLSARNVPALQDRLKEQGIFGLWQEPSVQKFLEKPLARLNEEIQKAETRAGLSLADVGGLFRGQVAISYTLDPETNEPEALFLMDVGDRGEKAMQVAAAVLAAANEKAAAPATAVEEKIDGRRFIRLQAAAPEGGAAPAPEFTYGVAGDVFVLGHPLRAVQRTVAFLRTPPGEALAGAPLYQALINKVSPDSDLVAFVNVPRLVAFAARKAPDASTAALLNALGLNGLGALGGGMTFAPDYYTTRVFLQTTGTPQGLVNILLPAPGPLHAGTEAPADASGFLSLRFEPTVIWDEVEKVLGATSPGVLALINGQMQQAAQQLGQPFNLRNDIFSVFGPRLAFYSRYEKPYTLQSSQQVVFLLDISSKAAFNALVEKLRKVAPEMFAQVEQRDYLGHALYVLPAQGMARPGQAPERMAFVATEKEFIFSTRVEAVEAHLRRAAAEGPTLATRPEFQDGLRGLPADGRVLIGFSDPARQIEYLLTILREGQLASALGGLKRDVQTAEMVDLFDFTQLPPAADIVKYLSPAATTAVVQPDGLLVISKSRTRAAAAAK